MEKILKLFLSSGKELIYVAFVCPMVGWSVCGKFSTGAYCASVLVFTVANVIPFSLCQASRVDKPKMLLSESVLRFY